MRVFIFIAFMYMIYLFVRSVRCVHGWVVSNYAKVVFFNMVLIVYVLAALLIKDFI